MNYIAAPKKTLNLIDTSSSIKHHNEKLENEFNAQTHKSSKETAKIVTTTNKNELTSKQR